MSEAALLRSLRPALTAHVEHVTLRRDDSLLPHPHSKKEPQTPSSDALSVACASSVGPKEALDTHSSKLDIKPAARQFSAHFHFTDSPCSALLKKR